MKDIKEPLLILIIIFIIVGLSYDPAKKAVEKNSATKSNSSLSKSNENQNISKSIEEIRENVEKIEKEYEKQVEERSRSPYYNKVRMSRISNLNNKNPNKEYITLRVYAKDDEKINITGWYLKSEKTGYYAIIGRASLLPFPFTRTESDIILEDKDKVVLTKGFSPIGISFKLNICTGYFEENRTFYPSLPRQCPKASDENLPIFSNDLDRDEECVDLISKIGRCTTKGNEYLRDLPDTITQFCKDYIKNQINYNSCVANNLGDKNFAVNEYRVFLNRFGPLWRSKNEKVNLYDRNGLIVDSISW